MFWGAQTDEWAAYVEQPVLPKKFFENSILIILLEIKGRNIYWVPVWGTGPSSQFSHETDITSIYTHSH